MAKKPAKPWPKLSETLPNQSRLQCNSCRAIGPLTYWVECDEDDRRQAVFVVLCQACADEIIDPHPRLYVELLPNECMPGAMEVCDDCTFRSGLSCKTPKAKFNGGEGLKFTPSPTSVHFCSRGRGGVSGWHFFMPERVQALLAGGQKCNGKEVAHG